MVTTTKACGGMEHQRCVRTVTNKLKRVAGRGYPDSGRCHRQQGLWGFPNRGCQVVSHVTGRQDTPHLEKLIGPVKGAARRLC